MSDDMVRMTNEAWRDYQVRLGSLTELQEAQVEKAFRTGWRRAVEALSTPAKPATEA